MTDPTAAANRNDDATPADSRPAPPDAAAPAKEVPEAVELAKEVPETAVPTKETPDAVDLAKEAADYKDKLLRALADVENLRRRTDREVADARTYGISSLARDVVGVADNLRRALDAAGESAAVVEGPAKALHKGVELIEREMLKVLERHGVKKFDPQGVKFDPNFHQAIFEVSDAKLAAGTVAQVIQPGYMIGERVLRPAMVGVAKDGPKPANSEATSNETQTG
jgi:molecular chaperone GrpE